MPVVKGRLKVFLRGCPRRPDLAGCVYTRRRYRIYLRRHLRDKRGVFYHELGHLFDLRVMRRRHRRAYKRIFGLGRRRAWFGGRQPPGEQFAEAYSYCARYRRIRGTRTSSHARYGYRASAAQHQLVCQLIKRAAAKPPRRPDPPDAPPVIVEPARTLPPAPPAQAPPPPKNGLGRLVDAIF